MKKFLSPIVFLLVTMLFVTACATRQTVAEREATAAEIRSMVESFEFMFVPRSAHPTGFRTIQLTQLFDVDVSPDMVRSGLPFFGRAFRAPLSPMDAGYHFTSTEFDYTVKPGRRDGNWLVRVVFNDLGRNVIFDFDIWGSGSARLRITDPDRQSISFQGYIEMRRE